jgi:hypothetical protein
MDIQDEQDKDRRSSDVTFSCIGRAPQADGASYTNNDERRTTNDCHSPFIVSQFKLVA